MYARVCVCICVRERTRKEKKIGIECGVPFKPNLEAFGYVVALVPGLIET